MAKNTCTAQTDGALCGKPVHGRGLCNTHYRSVRREMGLERSRTSPRQCSISDCGGRVHGNDLCSLHYQRLRRTGKLDPLSRRDWFFMHVDFNGPLPSRSDLGPCHVWLAARTQEGYGKFGNTNAHIFAFEDKYGPVPRRPDGYGIESGRRWPLDHFACDNRACVNPDHVAVSTPRANVLRSASMPAINARKTHCKRGHEFTPENTRTYVNGNGVQRVCRTCNREQMRARRARANDPIPVEETK